MARKCSKKHDNLWLLNNRELLVQREENNTILAMAFLPGMLLYEPWERSPKCALTSELDW